MATSCGLSNGQRARVWGESAAQIHCPRWMLVVPTIFSFNMRAYVIRGAAQWHRGRWSGWWSGAAKGEAHGCCVGRRSRQGEERNLLLIINRSRCCGCRGKRYVSNFYCHYHNGNWRKWISRSFRPGILLNNQLTSSLAISSCRFSIYVGVLYLNYEYSTLVCRLLAHFRLSELRHGVDNIRTCPSRRYKFKENTKGKKEWVWN